MYSDYVEYIDSLYHVDSDQKAYTTLDTLAANVKKTAYTSVQYLETEKKNSLTPYTIALSQDSTLFGLCFLIYGSVNDELIDKLIEANDLLAYNRLDIDPNNPIIPRGTNITYYA